MTELRFDSTALAHLQGEIDRSLLGDIFSQHFTKILASHGMPESEVRDFVAEICTTLGATLFEDLLEEYLHSAVDFLIYLNIGQVMDMKPWTFVQYLTEAMPDSLNSRTDFIKMYLDKHRKELARLAGSRDQGRPKDRAGDAELRGRLTAEIFKRIAEDPSNLPTQTQVAESLELDERSVRKLLARSGVNSWAAFVAAHQRGCTASEGVKSEGGLAEGVIQQIRLQVSDARLQRLRAIEGEMQQTLDRIQREKETLLSTFPDLAKECPRVVRPLEEVQAIKDGFLTSSQLFAVRKP